MLPLPTIAEGVDAAAGCKRQRVAPAIRLGSVTMCGANEPYGSAPHDDWADQDAMRMRVSLWSALQTHLQGGDGATLAVVPEISNHAQPSLLIN